MFDKMLEMYGFDESIYIFLEMKKDNFKDEEDILVVEKKSE